MTHLSLQSRSFLCQAISALVLASLSYAALAQHVVVQDPWARATVQAQKSTGVFMRLASPSDARLVGVSSPVAAFGEVHEMRMDGDVMKMHALKRGLELPAGKAVELKPGGYHIMLMDLKQALAKNSTIPLTLTFVDAKGVESKTELTVPVKAMAHMGTMDSMK